MSSEIIESIETQLVDLPLKRIHKFSATSINNKAFLLVRIRTRSGILGVGEATTPGGPWWAGEAIETIQLMIEKYFAPLLIGEDAMNITRLLELLDRCAANNNFAKAAVEMALLDIKGKALDVPVYELFGGLYRDSAVINWPLAMGDAAADIEEAERMMADNLAHDFKVKMGYKSPTEDVSYIGELCRGLNDRASVRGDLNASWNEAQARSLLPQLREHGLLLMEQPLEAWNREGLARLRQSCDLPILADESACTQQDARELLTLGAADAISLKPLKSGGLLATQKIVAIAASGGVPCYAGTFLESSIGTASHMHLVAALPQINYGNELVGPIWLADDIVEAPVEYRDNRVWVKHEPGLGITLDEDKVLHYLRR